MTIFLKLFILIPLIGLICSFLLPPKEERIISWAAFIIVGTHFFSALFFLGYWLTNGLPTLQLKEIVLIKTHEYEFFIDFFFDKVTAVYLLVGSFLTFLVTIYSRAYMHREEGYKRFFNTILFFFMGYNITIFSGNFETLFIGWEILGMSSFLLIAFYRERYLPVKNAIKVFSIYRIGDVGLILAMWLSHHLWHENITFLKLSNSVLVHSHLQNHTWVGVFISLLILVTAAAKSAQLPFCSWLPRAMEGPTPSSAIFYGSLSVHLGAFLLLRTYPFWENQISVRIVIGLLGLFTSIIASWIARTQSSVKSQIAYSSIGQIGLIFIEIAAGLDYLALFHFAGNAFLRTYQLLVSPSVVSYLIREQFFNFVPHKLKNGTWLDYIPKRMKYTLYILSLKEWNLGLFMYNIYWHPMKVAGNKLEFITYKRIIIFLLPAYAIATVYLFTEQPIAEFMRPIFPILFSVIGLMMILKSFTERKRVLVSWAEIIMNHFWVALSIMYNAQFELYETIIYLSGVVIAGIGGYITLEILKRQEMNIHLDRFRGHAYEHPKIAFVFLLMCLGVSGFPISPTFIGEDLIFSHIREDQFVLAFIISIIFILNGLSIIRLFARLFLGPHSKTYHALAYRSS